MIPLTLDGTITFADGLPGFETCRQFVLVAAPSLSPFMLVQGVGHEGPSFVAVDPRLVEPAWTPAVEPSDLARLDASAPDRLLWLALVAARPDGTATVNLRAPLAVNPASMRGIQLIAPESAYRVDHPLTVG